ncbi:MAG: membrane protein insertase YidC [Microscillaceae bacterium]|jgi:YidC/Oxa1 family membrane protein insertase|nr:membrane protein insertase YidC [Microscillaceae bacterium]
MRDNNQITFLLLTFLLLTIYFQFFAPLPEDTEVAKNNKIEGVKKQATLKAQAGQKDLQDSAKAAQLYGSFATYTQGKSQDIVLENSDVKFTFSTQGANFKQVWLKKYQTFDKKPLILADEKSTQMGFYFKTQEGKTIDLRKLIYQADAQSVKADTQAGKITFKLDMGEGKSIEQIYTLPQKGYLLGYEVKLKGLEKLIDVKKPAEFFWSEDMKRVDSDVIQTRYYSTVNYNKADNSFDYLYWPDDNQQTADIKEKMHWVSFKQKFFSSAIIAPNKNFSNTALSSVSDLNNDNIIKSAQAALSIAATEIQANKGSFQFYFGPNQYEILGKTKIDNFAKNVHMGWPIFSFFTRYLILPIFSALQGVVSNYGIIIILMVLIIKLLVLPLGYSSYVAMAKMKVMNDIIKPELDAFKAKNGLDKANLTMEEQQKVSQEQFRLFQELGTSPFASLSGCVPLLLQMPIFIALFIFFPNAIELRHQSFLWAHDLSTFDSIITLPFTIPGGFGSHVSLFNILMTASTLAVTYFQSQNQANIQGPMKYMMYIMPLVLMFVLNSYPAGLNFYYLVQNLVSIGQQALIKKFMVNENSIRAKFEDYKKNSQNKPKKKSSFMQMLEEAQKKQQEQIEAKKKLKEGKKNK